MGGWGVRVTAGRDETPHMQLIGTRAHGTRGTVAVLHSSNLLRNTHL